jgi:hypothetical protein
MPAVLDVTEYDPAVHVTAKELRAIGFAISPEIPDCAWVPRLSLVWKPHNLQHAAQPAAVFADGLVHFTVPFQWLEVTVTVE